MKAIIAVNNLGFIGLSAGLPWPKCKSDFKHFKEKTIGCSLLVGYNTYQTLPPLKDRSVIVDPRDSIILANSVDWCIGGKKTYEKYAKYFTELHISHINNNTIGDTAFPDLTSLNPNCKIYNYYFEPDTI